MPYTLRGIKRQKGGVGPALRHPRTLLRGSVPLAPDPEPLALTREFSVLTPEFPARDPAPLVHTP